MDGQTAKKEEVGHIKLTLGSPYDETVREHKLNLDASPDSRKFEVSCNAGNAGHLEVVSDAVSVRIGQLLRREGKEEFWGSLLVECKERDDGSLTVDVVVFHPDWDEPLRIASIQSSRSGRNGLEQSIQCNFEQKRL